MHLRLPRAAFTAVDPPLASLRAAVATQCADAVAAAAAVAATRATAALTPHPASTALAPAALAATSATAALTPATLFAAPTLPLPRRPSLPPPPLRCRP